MKLLRNITEVAVNIAVISVAVTIISNNIPKEVKANAKNKVDAVMSAIKEQENRMIGK